MFENWPKLSLRGNRALSELPWEPELRVIESRRTRRETARRPSLPVCRRQTGLLGARARQIGRAVTGPPLVIVLFMNHSFGIFPVPLQISQSLVPLPPQRGQPTLSPVRVSKFLSPSQTSHTTRPLPPQSLHLQYFILIAPESPLLSIRFPESDGGMMGHARVDTKGMIPSHSRGHNSKNAADIIDPCRLLASTPSIQGGERLPSCAGACRSIGLRSCR